MIAGEWTTLGEIRRVRGMPPAPLVEQLGWPADRMARTEVTPLPYLTVQAVGRYLAALGATVRIEAVFGDERILVAEYRHTDGEGG